MFDRASVIIQGAAALISFATALIAAFAYTRYRKPFFLHVVQFFCAFFLISANSALSLLLQIYEAGAPMGSALSASLGVAITVLFVSGLLGLVFDLLRVAYISAIRLLPWIYIVLSSLVSVFLAFSSPGSTASFVQNLLGIWIPSGVSVACAILFKKRYNECIYRHEKRLFTALALGNSLFFLLSIAVPGLSMVVPFAVISCVSILVLSIAFRHFFSSPLDRDGDSVSVAFIDDYSITPRETQIINALLGGKTNQELADILFVSPKTIETHLGNIYRKTGLKNRLELFALLKRR